MPAPTRPSPVKVIPDSTRFTNGIVGHYSDLEVDALLAGVVVGNVDLTDYAKVEDLPVVYEQGMEPTGKDGDIWLKPADGLVPLAVDAAPPNKMAMTVADVRNAIDDHVGDTEPVMELQKQVDYLLNNYLLDPTNAVANEFKQVIFSAVRSMLTGGKEPPPDIGWTECPRVAGAGLVEARLTNGTVYLRGVVTITTTAWTHVRNLPANFPKPAAAYATVTTAGETGIAERVCQVSIRSNGQIWINSFTQKITSIDTFPATAPV